MRFVTIFGAATLLVAGCAAPASPSTTTDDVEVAHPIEALADLALDPESGELSFSYGTGGGCEPHAAKTSVALAREPSGLVARVTIVDTSPRPDFCEAFLTVSGKADLKQLIAAEAQRCATPVAGQRVALALPGASVSLRADAAETKPSAGAVKTRVRELRTMALDRAGTFDFAYVTGGGCATHVGVASVDLVRAPDGGITAKLQVEDVASAFDPCEALVGVEGKADVHALIATAARAAGTSLDGQRIRVELPRPALEL